MKSEFERMCDELQSPGMADNVEYIGDAVYASYDGYHVWLSTTDGLTITNRIALEPNVLDCLIKYLFAQGILQERNLI